MFSIHLQECTWLEVAAFLPKDDLSLALARDHPHAERGYYHIDPRNPQDTLHEHLVRRLLEVQDLLQEHEQQEFPS